MNKIQKMVGLVNTVLKFAPLLIVIVDALNMVSQAFSQINSENLIEDEQ